MIKGVLLDRRSYFELQLYGTQIAKLEQEPDITGFRQTQAQEMFLVFNTKDGNLIGKVEFSRRENNNFYMDWIISEFTFGVQTFQHFVEKVCRPSKIMCVQFIITTSADERSDTICRRMNYYKKFGRDFQFKSVDYDKDDGSTIFCCEIKVCE